MKKKTKKKETVHQLNLRNVRLSSESKRALKKVKSGIKGWSVADSIENGNWYVPSDTYEFADVKTAFEKSMHDFYDIPEDVLVEVDCYDGDIMSFEKGIYPKWHKR